MFQSIAELLEYSAETGQPLHALILEAECRASDRTMEEILDRLAERYHIMTTSAGAALDCPQEMAGNLIRGQSSRQFSAGGRLSGPYLNRIMARALSCSEVNASMGIICAAPTAGACGVLPAVLIETAALLGSTETETLNALAVAGGIGEIIMQNASVSGAEAGCQAECGVAAAMAAAAAVYLAGGAPDQCAQAVSLALINCMGLICDPIAGLVQMPCSFRNASQAVNAVISADMALAGQNAVIPADEVIESMYRVGKQLPMELRETSKGGIATSPTGRAIAKKLQQEWSLKNG